MTPFTASQVTVPGAYTWVDHKGDTHVGFITKDARSRLAGAFISSAGNVRATLFDGPGESSGLFCGPLCLPTALSVAQKAKMIVAGVKFAPAPPVDRNEMRALAAKAAGAFIDPHSVCEHSYFVKEEISPGFVVQRGWSAESHADLLRLVIQLGINLRFEGVGVDEVVFADDIKLHSRGDRDIAVREAILRAVAVRMTNEPLAHTAPTPAASDTAIIAAAIKKHRDNALITAGMGEPVTADACAEAIARTVARFAQVNESEFLRACGIGEEPASAPASKRKSTSGVDKHISLPGGCGINKF